MIRLINLIKKNSQRIVYSILFASLMVLTVYSSIVDNTFVPAISELSIDERAEFHSTSYQKSIKKSRNSAVRLISVDGNSGMVSTFSGTYVKSYGNYFVVTVAHGMAGPCEFTKVVYNRELYDCVKVIEINDMQDYAVIQVGEIKSRTAVRIPQDLPRNKQWHHSFTALSEVVYTGYPNSIGPLSVGGKVAGANGTEFIYLDSYAWEGSSGAGVFDSKGKYIGYVVAIDVGSTDFGVQVLNNVVLVIPAFKIDWTKTITEAE